MTFDEALAALLALVGERVEGPHHGPRGDAALGRDIRGQAPRRLLDAD